MTTPLLHGRDIEQLVEKKPGTKVVVAVLCHTGIRRFHVCDQAGATLYGNRIAWIPHLAYKIRKRLHTDSLFCVKLHGLS